MCLGNAFALKKKKSKDKFWCFVGDMANEMGIFHESWKYALHNKLLITFIIEDNEIGCYTPTNKAWGFPRGQCPYNELRKIIYYKYKRKYLHYGVGKWITF